MHVLILLLILLAIWVAAIYWKFSVPIIFLLIYFFSTVFGDKESRNKVRFHTLWVMAIMAVLAMVFYGERAIDFASDWTDEYSNYDDLSGKNFSKMDSVKCVDVEQAQRLEMEDEKRLIGPLEVGMWPVKVTYLMRKWKEMESIELAGVRLSRMDRHYYRGRLYGISFAYDDDSLFSQTDSIVGALKQKYGPLQLETKRENVYRVGWLFEHKHVVLESQYNMYFPQSSLYIYEPNLRLKKELKKDEQLKRRIERENRMRQKEMEEKKRHEERIKLQLQEKEQRKRELIESI